MVPLGEWGTAGAILREEDIGLASASKKDQEDAAAETWPIQERPAEVRPGWSVQTPVPRQMCQAL